jgi:hypothetical protein
MAALDKLEAIERSTCVEKVAHAVDVDERENGDAWFSLKIAPYSKRSSLEGIPRLRIIPLLSNREISQPVLYLYPQRLPPISNV